MKKTHIFVAAMLLSASISVFGQEPSSKKSDQESDPDYSRQAVLEIFLEDLKSSGARFDAGFRYDTETTRFHWVPFVAPFFFDTGGDVTTPLVDPFYLTGTSFPYTSGTARDRLGEWRMRRFLRKNAEAGSTKP